MWVACLVLIVLALLLDFLRIDDILSYPWQTRRNDRALYPVYAVLTGMVSLVYPTTGALIDSRLPKNPVGWIFCGVGLLYQLHHFALAYSNYALAENLSGPWSEYANALPGRATFRTTQANEINYVLEGHCSAGTPQGDYRGAPIAHRN